VVFPAAGNYRFEIVVNGVARGEVPLELVQVTEDLTT
jgi:hypothetical protein